MNKSVDVIQFKSEDIQVMVMYGVVGLGAALCGRVARGLVLYGKIW